jgi:prepilin-type processing-associated H-X9-DG protein
LSGHHQNCPQMNPPIRHPVCRHDKIIAAFTLLELAVIVAVVGFLTALFAANLFHGSSQIKRAQCAANLKQFTLALHLYANDYEGKLPRGNGDWAWDLNFDSGSVIERYAGNWRTLYCPGNDFTDADNQTLFKYGAFIGFRVLGYATTLPGTSLIDSNLNTTVPPIIQVGFNSFISPLPSERVLVADATISQPGQFNPAQRFSATYSYTGIQGGFYKPHASAHLSGRFPLGGNLGMADGHVSWRKFADMQPRVNVAFNPCFWW